MSSSTGNRTLPYILLAALLSACGGGGGQVAGIGGTGITSSGTITGFGSIFVNGVEFETSGAQITLDDSPGIESDLGLGMVVVIHGTVNDDGVTGTATSVVFDDEVQGPVNNDLVLDADMNNKKFTVLGIPVQANRTATVYDDGVTFDSLAPGLYIEVSGFVDAAGVLQATRIEGKGTFIAGSSEVELKGTIQNHVPATMQFELGSLKVNYASADLSDLGSAVDDGLRVEVKGTLSGNTVTATRLEDDDDGISDDEARVSIEGIVTDFAGAGSFRVAGIPVNASSATLVPASLVLGNGIEVEVEGPVTGGTLQAVRVEARGGDIELEAQVQSASTVNGTITLQYANGTVTVLVDNRTSLRDDLDILDPFTLADVTASDFLEVRAALDGSGNIVASEIRRDSVGDDILQGPASSCTGSDVTILGVSFTLQNGFTSVENEFDVDVYGNSAVNFCNDYNARSVSDGLFIKVQDDLVGNGIADEAELEN